MTIPALTPDQLAVVDQYRTCEFATLSRSGLPIAWPISPLLQDDGTFLVTTSIALPQKAFNVRRDGRVALLFSDPTGSGVEHPSEVLVQGTAVCPAEVETTPARSGPLWRRIYERQPASKAYSANAVGRWFADFYYMRLHITVTPTAVVSRPALAAAAGPGSGPLAGYRTAVLGIRDEDGMPRLLRVGLGQAAGARVVLDVPAGSGVRPGPATLLAHQHDEQLWNLRSVVLVGALSEEGGTWGFVTSRVIPGTGNNGVVAQMRMFLGMRRSAARYLAERNLARPRIAWDEFDALK